MIAHAHPLAILFEELALDVKVTWVALGHAERGRGWKCIASADDGAVVVTARGRTGVAALGEAVQALRREGVLT